MFVALISCYGCAQDGTIEDDTIQPIVPKVSLQEITRNGKFLKKDLLILIDKSEYTLKVFHKDSLLITYPCVYGFNAIDDKHQEGDGCTPEGEFKIRSMYAHASWKYFIWVDYPNKESWRRFKERKANGDIEPSGTIGGEIGIHGVPEGMDDLISSKRNWTLGCISLTRADVTDLYKSINTTTTMKIVP
ncbi:MAG: murein L,D-transpeptidase YafK [Crocinitomicaceae bacterium]|jgi:murein L,D-transpeptidase YafK